MGLPILTGACVVAGLGLAVGWAVTTPRFVVDAVEVQGAERLSADRIAEAAAVPPGTNIFQIRPRELVARVEALPGIRRADVVRELPDRLVITVQERRPFTLAHAGRLVWIDEDGAVLDEARRAVSPPMPLIAGLTDADLTDGALAPTSRVRTAIALLRALLRSESALGDRISEIDVSRGDGPVLRTMDGLEVRLGPDDWPARLARLEAVLAQVAAQDPTIRVVDLRFRDQVVLGQGGAP